MEKNCSTCLHARSCGRDSECVKVCLNAGTFVYNAQFVNDCLGYEKVPTLQELYQQESLRVAI